MVFVFFKQKTAYEMRISDWSSDVCSSDLLKGTAISIRKFSEKPITIDMMAKGGSMSDKMATVLKIAGACRFNVVISGGTGSGKTTMLNAMSKMIDPGERVITIRQEEHTSEIQSLMRTTYAVLSFKHKKKNNTRIPPH